MKKIIFCLLILVVVLLSSHPSIKSDEIILKNGNILDYGPTWEKDEMIWFNFYDVGLAGIAKDAITECRKPSGTEQGENFIPQENKTPVPQN